MIAVYTIPLNESFEALVTLISDGQQPPSDGDKVKVKIRVELPTGSSGFLVPELCFEKRVPDLLGLPLDHYWGRSTYEAGTRLAVERVHASTWEEAKVKAMKYVEGQLVPLQLALAARSEALEKAGNWD